MLQGINDAGQNFMKRMFFWYGKVKNLKNRDIWVEFILLWIMFNAYLTEISKSVAKTDREKLDYFLRNTNDFKKRIQENRCWNFLLSPYRYKLKKLSPIPSTGSKTVYLKDENSIEDVFNFVYEIRCGLFHGSKDIKNDKDYELVKNAGLFLREAFGYINHWYPKK